MILLDEDVDHFPDEEVVYESNGKMKRDPSFTPKYVSKERLEHFLMDARKIGDDEPLSKYINKSL